MTRSILDGFTCAVLMEPDCSFSGLCIGEGEATADVQMDGAMANNNREILLVLSENPHFAGGATASGTARLQ